MKLYRLLILLLFVSCVDNDAPGLVVDEELILSNFLENKTYIKDNVIACAASNDKIPDLINVYFYPEEGAGNFKLYVSGAENGNDFSKYGLVESGSQSFLDGTMRQFVTRSELKWFVVVYKIENTIHISTPIRSKVFSQPTLYDANVTINQETSGMPKFSWDIESEENNAIFFEVVTTSNSEFLSGTYTHENNFQYYKLNNVVLNVTKGTPPDLILGDTYNFIVMDVSLDNWVNKVIMTSFTAE
ncbi:hypothetical protein [Seonamhaeicola marinus]|uniref:Uncharacterized protein n=1 Tax=Seonamhaeicola marinus TaxID=1912246 RepID=A0A5D0HTT8_9FLAO|nr:hypothetical protein [Seonamhaeicola marinus]TYA74813.1 hypothetical protein FUA24_16020 [Seonamhaeicola marinus]